ncbi:hypothetical protein [Lentilactobacillus sp. Marseille-Q4993]|uniref:hypothetical protein n=1 Tax=Lentilactobacillus sp. Marseille-Q4993 TaxID=3039492 RepID=UPI0024BD41FA|nr:hypothetical protein [Lentilactobacillus sp. Marseille-Q4993]
MPKHQEEKTSHKSWWIALLLVVVIGGGAYAYQDSKSHNQATTQTKKTAKKHPNVRGIKIVTTILIPLLLY